MGAVASRDACGNESSHRCDVSGVTIERCERCDLVVGQCEHTRPLAAPPRVDSARILVSPQLMAHLPGCGHNDESDLSRWGEIRGVSQAWERIGNGDVLETNAGAVLGRPARSRCQDCVNR